MVKKTNLPMFAARQRPAPLEKPQGRSAGPALLRWPSPGGSPIPGPRWGPSDPRNRGGCPDLIGTGEGLLPPPASRCRGAVRQPTDHSAVLGINTAHKLINMQDEKPRSYLARSEITSRYLHSRKQPFLLFDAQTSVDALEHNAGGGWGIGDWRFKI